MATNNEPNKLQSPGVLCRSASLAGKAADKTGRVPASTNQSSTTGSIAPTHQGVRVAFFFDGTGNNLEADVGNDEHSNVARLFRAHPEKNPSLGIFRYYIPGIGTRFKEIGDTGGETLGLAFGGKGQARLDLGDAPVRRARQPEQGPHGSPGIVRLLSGRSAGTCLRTTRR